MGSARLIVRLMVATVLIIIGGVFATFGFDEIIEPLYNGFGEPASSLNWGSPGSKVLTFSAASLLALILVIVIWAIAAPIQSDVRQEFRR